MVRLPHSRGSSRGRPPRCCRLLPPGSALAPPSDCANPPVLLSPCRRRATPAARVGGSDEGCRMNSHLPRLSAWQRAACGGLLALAGCLAYLTAHEQALAIDCDDLSFVAYARDLCGSGFSVRGWFWCDSLYWLPDQ